MTERPGGTDQGAISVLRRLGPDDAPAYRALMLQAYAEQPGAFTSSVAEREPLPLAWWAARLSQVPEAAEWVIGAYLNGDLKGDLLGVVGLRFNSAERTRHKALLFGMVVARAQRRLGLGRQLVAAACAAATARPGPRLLQLTVSEGNLPARRLYETCGFRPYGLEPMAVLLDGRPIAKLHLWRPVAGEPQSAWEDHRASAEPDPDPLTTLSETDPRPAR